MENSPQEKISKWLELNLFFKKRIITPFDHPEFLIYFILVIIGFGGIGIWFSLYDQCSSKNVFSHLNVISNILSFSVAIVAAGSIELMFVENKILKTPLLLISVSIIILSSLFYLVLIKNGNPENYFFVIPSAVFSLFIWWIANAENSNLTKNYFIEQSEASKKLNQSLNDYE
jgi:hypothetical protein